MPKPNTAKSVRQSNRAAQVPGWELAPVADLKPAARRTRSHPKYKRQTLERSIAEQGLLDPITTGQDKAKRLTLIVCFARLRLRNGRGFCS